EMRLHADEIAQHEVWVAESPGAVPIGYHRVLAGDPAELEDLWVEPDAIGSGVGRRLFQHAIEVAAGLGASAFEIVSDPHAVGFYERMGAVVIGEIPSMLVAGRTLPLLRLDLRLAAQRKNATVHTGSGVSGVSAEHEADVPERRARI
ncbi:MAG: GNAT family N-acetyltransferase, partial [Candidatus Limnocylindria bacterium]